MGKDKYENEELLKYGFPEESMDAGVNKQGARLVFLSSRRLFEGHVKCSGHLVSCRQALLRPRLSSTASGQRRACWCEG